MNLTTEQINLIKAYCNHTSKYYDVEIELVDHFASYVESRMENDSDFENLFESLKKSFSAKDIALIIQEKKRAITQKARTQCWKELLSYFSWPKIGFTFLLFAYIVWMDQNRSLEKSAQSFMFLLNLLNFRFAFGRGMLANRNLQEKKLPILGMKIIYNYQLISIIPILLYFILALNTFNETSIIDFGIYKAAIYIAPFLFLLLLAWQKTYIDFQLKIRKDYPGAFAA
ncbi:MAG: hypothetical protein EAZ12_06360 [Sphingobacteriia bacterium]|nr:MAG: hypothetical protein EAZ12_06360 [Sphingobacteriia bacterium]